MNNLHEQARALKLSECADNVGYAEETIPVVSRRFGSWQISVRRLAFSSPELVRQYDKVAPGWGRTLDRLGYPGAYEKLLRRVLSKEKLNVDGARPRVLDCGVGTGALSSALARVSPTPFDLDGIDSSPGMLEQAGINLSNDNLELTLRHGDIRKLPYDDGVFDVVMTAHVLEHLVDPTVALNEMVRVLKPGGLMIAFVTRRSALGMLVHLKWRTHRVTPTQAKDWLFERGLQNVQCLSFDDGALRKRLSLACIGRKPELVGFETHEPVQSTPALSGSLLCG
jgi:demethylmenaquinone methyltransferase/2-methoxy-6-polyprenyl-1,4-benzoquinol methylase